MNRLWRSSSRFWSSRKYRKLCQSHSYVYVVWSPFRSIPSRRSMILLTHKKWTPIPEIKYRQNYHPDHPHIDGNGDSLDQQIWHDWHMVTGKMPAIRHIRIRGRQQQTGNIIHLSQQHDAFRTMSTSYLCIVTQDIARHSRVPKQFAWLNHISRQ